MTVNMSALDRGIRIIVAIAVAILIATGQLTGMWAWVLGIVAIVFLLTSLVRFCPLYALLGIRTTKSEQTK